MEWQSQPQAAQARYINYREFRYCFAYYERFKDFVSKLTIIYAPSLGHLCPNWSIFPSWLDQHYWFTSETNRLIMQTKLLVESSLCFWRCLRIGVWYSLKKACDNPSFVKSLCRIVRRYGLINIQKWQSMFCVLLRDVLHNVFFRNVHSFVMTQGLNPILFPVNFSVREETVKSRKVWFFFLCCVFPC